MATTVKSTDVSNLDLRPVTLNASYVNNMAAVKSIKHTVATTSIDEIGDAVLLMVLPSSCSVHSLQFANPDLDTGTSTLRTDIGIYNGPDRYILGGVTKAAYAVIDADAFVAASAQLSAAGNFTEVLPIAHVGKKLWEVAGLASDPGVLFTLAVTVTTAANVAASGDIAVRVLYVMG